MLFLCICICCIYRELHTHKIKLSDDEKNVYGRLQLFAQKSLAKFIAQQEQKLRDEFVMGGKVTFNIQNQFLFSKL